MTRRGRLSPRIDPENPTTRVAWSVERTTSDAVIDVARTLYGSGFRREDALRFAALVFATEAFAVDERALAASLEDVLGPVPRVTFVGSSVFVDLRIGEGQDALVVVLIEGGTPFARTAPSTLDAASLAATLLADGVLGRVRLLSSTGDERGVRATLLPALDEAGVLVVGAHRSRQVAPHSTTGLLFLDDTRVAVSVAESARPLSQMHTVTRVDGNVVLELDERRALEVLLEDLARDGGRDLALLRGRLALATWLDDESDDDGQAIAVDVTGLDPQVGALALAGHIETGARARFAIRDARAARANLESALFALKQALGRRRPRAVIVFTSRARGAAFFDVPLYDVERAMDVLGPLPIPVVGVASDAVIATAEGTSSCFSSACVIAALVDDD